MPKWLRALIAAYGAKKLGGGCLSTILIFVVIYYALGKCNRPAERRTNGVQTMQTAPLNPDNKKAVAAMFIAVDD